MKQIVLNLLALAVIGTGGTYLATQPVAAQEATTEATCPDGTSGECCKTDGETCACGPCDKILRPS